MGEESGPKYDYVGPIRKSDSFLTSKFKINLGWNENLLSLTTEKEVDKTVLRGS